MYAKVYAEAFMDQVLQNCEKHRAGIARFSSKAGTLNAWNRHSTTLVSDIETLEQDQQRKSQ